MDHDYIGASVYYPESYEESTTGAITTRKPIYDRTKIGRIQTMYEPSKRELERVQVNPYAWIEATCDVVDYDTGAPLGNFPLHNLIFVAEYDARMKQQVEDEKLRNERSAPVRIADALEKIADSLATLVNNNKNIPVE